MVTLNDNLIDASNDLDQDSETDLVEDASLEKKRFLFGFYIRDGRKFKLGVNFSELPETMIDSQMGQIYLANSSKFLQQRVVYFEGFSCHSKKDLYDLHHICFENIFYAKQVKNLLSYSPSKTIHLRKPPNQKYHEKILTEEEYNPLNLEDKFNYGCFLWVFINEQSSLGEDPKISIYEFNMYNFDRKRPFFIKSLGYLFGKQFRCFNKYNMFADLWDGDSPKLDIVGVIEFSGLGCHCVDEIILENSNGAKTTVFSRDSADPKPKFFAKHFYNRICGIHRDLVMNETESTHITHPYN